MYLRWDGQRPLADREMVAALYQVSQRTVRRHCPVVEHVPRVNPPPDVRGGTALYDALQAATDLTGIAPRPERTRAALAYRIHRDRSALPMREDPDA